MNLLRFVGPPWNGGLAFYAGGDHRGQVKVTPRVRFGSKAELWKKGLLAIGCYPQNRGRWSFTINALALRVELK